MQTIEERANLAAWQIYEEIRLSKHAVDRVAEIITEKIIEQKAIDDAKLLKLKSAWEKQAQINHDDVSNYKQGYHDAIEKACEWITEHIDIPYEGEFIDDSPVASDYIEWCEKRLEYAKEIVDAFKQAIEKQI